MASGGVIVVGVVGHFVLGFGQPGRLRYDVGAVQVLAGPDEAWLFLDKRVIEHYSGLDFGKPGLTVAYRQQVIVITGDGVKDRIAVPDNAVVSVHPNTTRVFRQDDGLYLAEGASMGWHAALFKWDRDHFSLLPLEAHERFVRTHGLNPDLPESDPGLDRVTEGVGWKHLLAKTPGSDLGWPVAFDWNGRRFAMSLEQEPHQTRVVLRCPGAGKGWETTLLAFDPTPQDVSMWESAQIHDSQPRIGHPRSESSPVPMMFLWQAALGGPLGAALASYKGYRPIRWLFAGLPGVAALLLLLRSTRTCLSVEAAAWQIRNGNQIGTVLAAISASIVVASGVLWILGRLLPG